MLLKRLAYKNIISVKSEVGCFVNPCELSDFDVKKADFTTILSQYAARHAKFVTEMRSTTEKVKKNSCLHLRPRVRKWG